MNVTKSRGRIVLFQKLNVTKGCGKVPDDREAEETVQPNATSDPMLDPPPGEEVL